ncbi:hypothetical protein N7462_001524 [Penicillium macrosclerotiorum]|uniref:uncharacterized protein n=1 Tax=Penicillium macrosclerotiorum TaxID=303699 RepID=UPI0025474751|nr:uncharacterized protein N7462_001524 [Penicillium macrosclerotiorum]KAJ5692101.1 hypothetical protein N7462_001524 [Penicillium macrosclerotiorum]
MRLSGIQFSRLPHHVIRRFRSSVSASQDDDVFANSLRKTVDAHRSSNRARLIRKTYPRSPAPGLFRPTIPPENRPGYQLPAPPVLEPFKPVPKKTKSKKHSRQRKPELNAQLTDARKETYAIRKSTSTRLGCPEQTPWLSYLELPEGIGDASAHLDAEILALDRYLSTSPREQHQIDQVRWKLVSLLKPVAPHAPKLIGSRATGLALAHSDLSLFLPYEDFPPTLDHVRKPRVTISQIQDSCMRLLHKVESALQEDPAFHGQVRLNSKNNRAVDAQHRPTGLSLHVVCGERVPAISEYLKDYLVEYPVLRPLYTSLRVLLETQGLYGSSQSGVGIAPSALALLVVAFLKMNHGRFPGSHRLGDQLLALLQFYSTGVDLQAFGVAVDPPSFFNVDILRPVPHQETEPAYLRGQRSLMAAKRTAAIRGNISASRRLCIQDPTHYMKDLGRSCTHTAELQSAFAAAYQQLRAACDAWDGPQENTSILTTALRANFDVLEDLRSQIVFPVDPH